MPSITSIKPQKSQKRVNVYLDNKFGFGIDLDNFIKLNLKVDQELSEKEVQSIKEKSEKSKILNKLLSFATLRPRSEKEIKDWFTRKKFDINSQYLTKLKKFDLLNDEKFAKWWVEQRLAFKKPSKKILNYELRIKGVKQEIINSILDEFSINEEKIAKDLLEKKKYKWERFEDKIKKKKIQTFLAGRGFSWNVISKVLQ